MKRTRQLFLLATVMVPLHIVERLLFGIDELYELQTMLVTAVNWFDDPDRATVGLVGLVVTMVLFFSHGFLASGWREFHGTRTPETENPMLTFAGA